MRRTTLFLSAVLVGACAVPGFQYLRATLFGHDTALYTALFPHPTGKNGYEDLVKAVDLWNASPACQQYEGAYDEPAGAPIEACRRALADPSVRSVLAELRNGIAKPVRSPRQEPSLTTHLPEYEYFRSLARLLRGDMELQIAEGHLARALDCLEEGLTFGRAIQVEGLASGVVGLYVENILLRAFARRLDQLKRLDSAGLDRLVQILDRHVQLPDPLVSDIAWERDAFLRDLRTHRSNPASLLGSLDPGPNASRQDRDDFAEVYRTVRTDPSSGPALFDEAAELARRHFDGSLAELARPIWERRYPAAVERNLAAAKLVFTLYPMSFGRMGDRFASEVARARILAAHVAVLRYKQGRFRLPGNLLELNLGPLAEDPFTGRPFEYRVLGAGAYSISSAGPREAGGSRDPIVVRFPPATDR